MTLKITSSSSSAELSNIRHNLKNHMSVIIAFAQLVKIEVKKLGKSPAVIDDFLTKIDQRAKTVVEEIDTNLKSDEKISS